MNCNWYSVDYSITPVTYTFYPNPNQLFNYSINVSLSSGHKSRGFGMMLSGIGRNLRRSSSYLTAQQTRHSNYTVTTTISQQSTILHLLFPCIELLELLHMTKGQG